MERAGSGQYDGWTASTVARRQHEAFAPLVRAAREGNPRLDFRIAAEAIAATGENDPFIVEVGCGSGYYSELLPLLLKKPIGYLGVDYSQAMITLAREAYPQSSFITADAVALPLAAGSCDICLSGTSLMHIPEYSTAIAEMVRVTRRWCVFHTVPAVEKRHTETYSKLAYGERVSETVFNRRHLETLFSGHGLTVRSVRESFPYDLSSIMGEPTPTLTFLCEKTG
jgi:SAM-dependent methyltransferase